MEPPIRVLGGLRQLCLAESADFSRIGRSRRLQLAV